MALKKSYLKKDKKHCKVTFSLCADAVKGAKEVCIAGDFNGWDTGDAGSKMKQKNDGSFEITLSLPKGKEYQFRYLIDGIRWENDWNADKYAPALNSAVDNSVVAV
jgi:1,4-alpha-glucan branching enzyme